MFRSNEDESLLCYNGVFCWKSSRWNELIAFTEFGLYVDEYGDLSRGIEAVELEGTAERIALHPPYILFDSRFIEIRHVEIGCLVQIISGDDIRCAWNDRGTNHSYVISGGSSDVSQEPRVHGVMNMEVSRLGKGGVTTQHVLS